MSHTSPHEPTPGAVPQGTRPRRLRRLLGALLLSIPLLEILLIILVGQAIGGWATFGLLLAGSVIGVIVIKREGMRSWRSLQEATQTGEMPSRSIADSGLILVGGLLLLVPGFLTDVLGVLLLLPFTRPIARVSLAYLVANKVSLVLVQPVQTWDGPGRSDDQPGAGTTVRGDVIE